MKLEKAVIKSFNSTDYTATVQLEGSQKAYLDDIAVARNISSAEMTAGRYAVILFFDEYNSHEAVIIAVYE
ncbi:MAG: hypothetical protein PHE15_04550 [Dehalococcoidales bacterium]|nr:hypothetical protein [Dehalococcoidales bacterium]